MLTLSEPDPGGGDDDERFVAPVQLVVSGCDSAKVLYPTEEALDEFTPFIEVAVRGPRLDTVCSRRNHRLRTGREDSVDQGLRVVGFIGSNRNGLDSFKQRLRFAPVGHLSGCQPPVYEVTEGFDQGMDLRCQSATRSANGLRAFFLPQ